MKPKKAIQVTPTSSPTHQQVADLVMTLPPDRLVSVWAFTLFVKSNSLTPVPVADMFGETGDDMRADEAEWARQFETSREELRAIGHEAAAEFRAGRTRPMAFTHEGRLGR